MQQVTHPGLALVLCCVALAVLFGLACVFDDDGDLGGALCQTEGPWCSPDELSRTLPTTDTPRRIVAPPARHRLDAAGLHAAVPGGICLLI